ncbi:hypothetical protein PAXRUDRAFT_783331 [Paxillus rubicundulus Ve08.2h10]|uniref:Uncharacterized protein n=1 Tax=Paxillus rubicundulus Ve08.2h10 TaxID=930991 RepID=A0A0D0CXW0_9AGAM|nr:hypothetical protein PAXRUDRAFT_783331 [Paxillus rubicundulus Ve08.2h10]
MSYKDWSQAYPCFIYLICKFLPGPDTGCIADLWQTHHNHIASHPNFFFHFQLYLHYNISIHHNYITCIDFLPSDWHHDVWDEIIDDFCTCSLVPSSIPSHAPSTSSLIIPFHSAHGDSSFPTHAPPPLPPLMERPTVTSVSSVDPSTAIPVPATPLTPVSSLLSMALG